MYILSMNIFNLVTNFNKEAVTLLREKSLFLQEKLFSSAHKMKIYFILCHYYILQKSVFSNRNPNLNYSKWFQMISVVLLRASL